MRLAESWRAGWLPGWRRRGGPSQTRKRGKNCNTCWRLSPMPDGIKKAKRRRYKPAVGCYPPPVEGGGSVLHFMGGADRQEALCKLVCLSFGGGRSPSFLLPFSLRCTSLQQVGAVQLYGGEHVGLAGHFKGYQRQKEKPEKHLTFHQLRIILQKKLITGIAIQYRSGAFFVWL